MSFDRLSGGILVVILLIKDKFFREKPFDVASVVTQINVVKLATQHEEFSRRCFANKDKDTYYIYTLSVIELFFHISEHDSFYRNYGEPLERDYHSKEFRAFSEKAGISTLPSGARDGDIGEPFLGFADRIIWKLWEELGKRYG